MKKINEIKIIGESKNEISNFKNSTDLIKNLSNEEIEIVKATEQGILIGSMNPEELINFSSRVVKLANAKLGITNQSDQDLELTQELIFGDLMNYKGQTDMIILQALKSGLNGEFSTDGKVFFSSSAFVIWVKKFITDKKMPTLAKYQQNKAIVERETPKPPPTIEQRKKIINDLIYDHKEKLSEDIDFEFPFTCEKLYEEFELLEIFSWPRNDKFQIYANVKKEFLNISDSDAKTKSQHNAWIKYIASLIAPKFV